MKDHKKKLHANVDLFILSLRLAYRLHTRDREQSALALILHWLVSQ